MEEQGNFSSFDKPQIPPENNMTLSIVGAVLGLCSPCCVGLIAGIVAIVYSSQDNTKFNAGDYAGAAKSASNAKILAYVAIGLGVLGLLINIIWYLVNKDSYMMMFEEYRNLGQ